MAAFHPHLADLPAEFPVFPLAGALLLPQGKLPLNIFEPRYLAMVEDALAPPRMFGMIMPHGGSPQGDPGLYRIGCLGRLSSFSETDDGRYLITLTGLIRFAVVEELPMRRGYRRVRGDFAGFVADLVLDEPQPLLDREGLLAALKSYFNRRGFEANWDAIRQMPEGMLVVTLAMACPFGDPEKQALLEAPTPAERATTLLALLQMDLHDEAGQGRRAS